MTDNAKTLEQRAPFHGYRKFVIEDRGTVLATYTGDGGHDEMTLNLAGINPNMRRAGHVAGDMILGMFLFSLPVLGFLWAAVKARFGSNAFFTHLGVAAVFAFPVFLCWLEYRRKSYDMLVFEEPLTGNHLTLLRSVPSLATVDAFVKELQAA